jgi:hypothetical protein
MTTPMLRLKVERYDLERAETDQSGYRKELNREEVLVAAVDVWNIHLLEKILAQFLKQKPEPGAAPER